MTILAVKTTEAINTALVSDQGAKFRGLLKKLMPKASDAYSTDNDPYRAHLGASLLGRKCNRELWYSFHWTTRPNFEGRILRLFNRGHLEEPRIVALLEMIDCTVWQADANGKQFRISGYKGHFGGSLDAVIRGCPDIPDEPILGEFKTHNDKSFIKLKAEGVLKAKYEHYVQMQMYMAKMALRWALYIAVNKNDDEIYAELIQCKPDEVERQEKRAVFVINSVVAPARINQSPGWHECRFCDHKPVCHGTAAPDKNCRTCVHIAVLDNGLMGCTNPEKSKSMAPLILSKEEQLAGCAYYVLNQGMHVSP